MSYLFYISAIFFLYSSIYLSHLAQEMAIYKCKFFYKHVCKMNLISTFVLYERILIYKRY